MKVLSLFDGMSNGQLALKNAGIKVDKYYASEIDKYAMSVTRKNFPDTIFIGDVTKINGEDFKDVDLVIGGSPCQGFSFAGKNLNFDDPRSALFFKYAEILSTIQKYNPDVKFFLENVKMKKESEEVITKYMGVEPILINSNLFTAQNRQRLYWTNIPFDKDIKDREIYWKDVQIDNAEGVMYYSDKAFEWLFKSEERKNKYIEYNKDSKLKMQMLEASHHKGYSNQRCFGIKDVNGKVRYIHPIECERLQSVPDNYTAFGIDENGKEVKISRTQRYKMLGNGWTVSVIEHFFKGLLNKF